MFVERREYLLIPSSNLLSFRTLSWKMLQMIIKIVIHKNEKMFVVEIIFVFVLEIAVIEVEVLLMP